MKCKLSGVNMNHPNSMASLFQSYAAFVELSSNRSLSHSCNTFPVISKEYVISKWGHIPESLHEELLRILLQVGTIYEVKPKFFIDSSLSSLPLCVQLEVPPTFDIGNEAPVPYVARCFKFRKMVPMYFIRLVTALESFVVSHVSHITSLSISKLYQNCVELEYRGGRNNCDLLGVCKITYDYIRKHVCLYTCETDPKKTLFCMIAEELATIFEDEANGFIQARPPVCVRIIMV